ncbi:flagellin [Vibrio pelagius]|uniref:Flagellin n=1 Tax=Vibrio pelagius TaxID=28169 RepID=A0ABY5G370_VIBPE|nr:flagellin [Vibrio pelagius]UTT84176.1 flagellin [Vibrio pelagius]
MVSIHTNISSSIAQRHLGDAQSQSVEAQSKLQSGSRINAGSDDAAGLQIANRLKAQTRGIDAALSNATNADSIAQTAEGALHESTNMLQKLRDLGLQASNGALSRDERESIQIESKMLINDLDRIASSTTFAGDELFDGSFGKRNFNLGPDSNAVSLTLKSMYTNIPQMGGQFAEANSDVDKNWRVSSHNQGLTIRYQDSNDEAQALDIRLKEGDDIYQVATYINGQQDVVRASVNEDHQLQLFAAHSDAPQGFDISGSAANTFNFGDTEAISLDDVDMTTVGGAQVGVAVIDASLNYVDGHRSEIGGFQNGVSRTMNSLNNTFHRIADSEGQIKDTDYAKLTTELTKSQMLERATSTLFAQANQNTSTALSLLG